MQIGKVQAPLSKPGVQALDLALAHIEHAVRLAGKAPLEHLRLGGDQVLDVQVGRSQLGDETVGGGGHDHAVAGRAVRLDLLASAAGQARPHRLLKKPFAPRLPLRSAERAQGADIELAKRLHIDRAGLVLAGHVLVAAGKRLARQQALLHQKLAPQLVAVPIEQGVIEVEQDQGLIGAHGRRLRLCADARPWDG